MSADIAAQVAQRFLAALEHMDTEAALACFGDDAVQEMPFAPRGFPDRLVGKAELRHQYGGLSAAYAGMRFDVSETRPMADPEWVLLEYRGSIVQRDGSRCDNRYAGLFRVVDGLIVLFREYSDPLILQRSFGTRLADPFPLPVNGSS